jgi:hypothetical protein
MDDAAGSSPSEQIASQDDAKEPMGGTATIASGEKTQYESDGSGSDGDSRDGSDCPYRSDMSSTDEREALRYIVTEFIQCDPCRRKCLVGKAAAIEEFVRTYNHFTPAEKRASIITALAVLHRADAAQPTRSRSQGARKRFTYYLPFVGPVCKRTFEKCFNVSSSTITRYKAKIMRGQAITH